MAKVRSYTSGASQSSQRVSDKFRSYLAHHRRVFIDSFRGLMKTWVSSLMTWLVIGIALALPAILLVVLNNVARLSGDWDGSPRVSVYLKSDVSKPGVLADRISAWDEVDKALAISAEEALQEFQDLSGFGKAVLALDKNPLPAVVVLTLSEDRMDRVNALVERLKDLKEVDSVSVDLEWIQRLFAIISLGQRMVTSLGLFLALGVLLIVGNTIRMAIENRRNEIEVVKLVGGTDAFVRRPFLYLGFWYGIGGSFVAWLLVAVCLLYLDRPVKHLAGAYNTPFDLEGLNLDQTGMLWGLGIFLGVSGAWLAVNRHLSDIEPQ